MSVRAAEARDVDPLAELWWGGWHDAHADILPAALARLRTLESFRARLQAALPQIRTLGPIGEPLGFHYVKGDELYQFYVAARARGAGVAGLLMQDAEARLTAQGVTTVWLACAIGNGRAARFYEKSGWRLATTETVPTETSEGPFPIEVWRYEKHLAKP